MYDDNYSISVLSTLPDIETIYTPTETEQGDDDFELLSVGEDDLSSDTDSSCSTSLLPIVHDHEYAHGRRYHGYKRGRYPLPNDLYEQQREDTSHAMMLQLTRGQLFFSDIGDYPQKIIDIGTGTGLWAIDVADLYPSATVIGTDLSPVQPTWLPVNVHMYVEDCEEPHWLHGSGYNLIHFRNMAGTLRDLDGMLTKIYPHVEEGGFVEFQELIPEILCDDGTMREDDPLVAFCNVAFKGMHKLGHSAVTTDILKERLEHAGFTDVQCIAKKIPLSTWACDRNLQTLGVFMKNVVLDALDAFAKPFDALGIPAEEVRVLKKRARESLENSMVHRYLNCVFCYGRKEVVVSDSESYYGSYQDSVIGELETTEG